MKHVPSTSPVVCAVLCAAVASAAQESPAPRDLSPDQVEALLDGDVIASVERDGNNNRAELVCIIDAHIDQVWEVITDYESYESWFPDQREARVREDNGDTHVLYGETQVPLLRNRTYELRDELRAQQVDGDTHYVNTWDYIPGSGNLDSTTGFWYLHPLDGHPGKTVVRMVVFADLGMWIPQGLINWGTRNMLPGIAEGIQEQCDAQ